MANKSGVKKRGSHGTVIEGADEVIKAAEREPSVTGVKSGTILPKKKSAPRRIDIKPLNPKQLLVKVHHDSTIQEIIIWTTNQERVEQILRDAFESK